VTPELEPRFAYGGEYQGFHTVKSVASGAIVRFCDSEAAAIAWAEVMNSPAATAYESISERMLFGKSVVEEMRESQQHATDAIRYMFSNDAQIAFEPLTTLDRIRQRIACLIETLSYQLPSRREDKPYARQPCRCVSDGDGSTRAVSLWLRPGLTAAILGRRRRRWLIAAAPAVGSATAAGLSNMRVAGGPKRLRPAIPIG
jgi:hypothetical protein